MALSFWQPMVTDYLAVTDTSGILFSTQKHQWKMLVTMEKGVSQSLFSSGSHLVRPDSLLKSCFQNFIIAPGMPDGDTTT